MLHLSRTKIKEFPKEILALKNLESLEFNNLPFKKILGEIGTLTKLESISLSKAGVTGLPRSIGKLKKLKELDLSGSKVTTLPAELGGLDLLWKNKGLKLEGAWNDLTSPPWQIVKEGQAKYKEYFNIGELSTYPDELVEMIREARKSGAEELVLEDFAIETIPDEICDMTFLKSFTFRSTERMRQINEDAADLPGGCMYDFDDFKVRIPKRFGKLVNLETLNLNTYSSSSDLDMSKLKKLKELKLGCHNYKKLPTGLGQLRGLKKMTLMSTHENTKMPELSKLTGLEVLELNCENIKNLAVINTIPNLRELKLYTRFTELAVPDLSRLKNLETLRIRYDDMEEETLKERVFTLTGLKKLELECRFMESMPQEIVNMQNLEELKIDCEFLKRLPKTITELDKLWDSGGPDIGKNDFDPGLRKALIKGRKSVKTFLAQVKE
ncbi:MAG: leucine-rich repeat domain-containing protein [bacterium]|nr:leucine-rich repeat domain-containing protein [bacterium]